MYKHQPNNNCADQFHDEVERGKVGMMMKD